MTRRLSSWLVCGLLHALVFSQAGNGQEPQKDEPQNFDIQVDIRDNLGDLAAGMASRIEKTCKGDGCTVAVADFTFADGKTSKFGKQLADDLFAELTRHNLRVIDPQSLRDALEQDRIHVDYEHRTFVQWILGKMHARFMIAGTVENLGDGAVRVVGEIVDGQSKNYILYDWGVHLRVQDAQTDLAPVDTLRELPPLTDASGMRVGDGGADITKPTCKYMPNPPFPAGASLEKFRGEVKTEAVINTEGQLESIRIVQGMPLGLNEQTIATMRTWRCCPAMKDGKPVAVEVMYEVNFRTY
jgi:TonB family protein